MLIILSWMLVAFVARLLEQSWWTPGSLLGLVLGTNAAGTVIFAPEYYMSQSANSYLQLLVLVTSLGSMVGQRIVKGGRTTASFTKLTLNKRAAFLLFGLISAVSSAYFTFRSTGILIGDLTSPLGVLRAAQRITYQRYTEGLEFPIAYNISNALLLSYAMGCAIYFTAARKIDRVLLIPLVIYFASNMLTTARGPILFMLILMAFAAIYTGKLTSDKATFISMREPVIIKTFVAGLTFIIAVFVLFQILRFGESSGRTIGDVVAHLRRWPWGSLPGFSLWFDGYVVSPPKTVPGYYTFMGIYDNLGIAERRQGVYDQYVDLTRGEPANIYTTFRGLHHDFGAIGSGVLLFIIGLIGGRVSRAVVGSPYMSLPLYIGIMSFICYTFVISTWAYTSNIAALIALPLVLRHFSGTDTQRPSPTIRGFKYV